MKLDNVFIIWTPRILSVLRVVATLVFMRHISQLMYVPKGDAGFVKLYDTITFWGTFELIIALFLILGLFTRLASIMLAANIAIAGLINYFSSHVSKTFFPVPANGSILEIVLFLLFLYIAYTGGGVWSVDTLYSEYCQKRKSSAERI